MEAALREGLAREHGRYLWGLCYRLTGSAADAEDLVQDTFVRALERPPTRADEPLRPWLTRVAVNLGIDRLRARRRRRYVGPWLPTPVETDEEDLEMAVEPRATEGRYDLLESVSMAFLVAIEALTPKQRAVLLLSDVFDYPVKEVAAMLSMSESAVKTMHHRAREALASYDASRERPSKALIEDTKMALGKFLQAIGSADGKQIEALLDAEVRHLSDGGGEFLAARVPVLGRSRVTRMLVGLGRKYPPGEDLRLGLRIMNGLPALVLEQRGNVKMAPRSVLQCEIGPDGKIRGIYWVFTTHKLCAVTPLPL